MTDTSQSFEKHYTTLPNRALFRWVDIRKKAVLRRFMQGKTNLNVLDFGCGMGAVSKDLTNHHQVFGVDFDPALLKHAQANGLSTKVGTFESIPFDDGFFDVVLMIDTIEHIQSRRQTMAEIKRVLKPQGTLFAITPCYSSCLWLLGETFANFVSRTKHSGHITPFTQESFSHLLSEHFSQWDMGRLNCGMWMYGYGKGAVSEPMDKIPTKGVCP